MKNVRKKDSAEDGNLKGVRRVLRPISIEREKIKESDAKNACGFINRNSVENLFFKVVVRN